MIFLFCFLRNLVVFVEYMLISFTLSLQILSEPVPSIQTDVLKALLLAYYAYVQSSVSLGFRIFKRNYTNFYHTFAFTSEADNTTMDLTLHL